MTTRLAPPPVIPIPPASPQPLPPLSPRYQPFQAWDDDHVLIMLVTSLEYHEKIENVSPIQNDN
ncbi:hypothetical protein AMATHDRAFT_11416 [Amanita thiersii Skay4041]|uniref:Uncharacterized protein n=1 Tax=Amanita thiersii Skay4041 TaxID=703135 RepID=A0A2A9NA55_9AGAR|nr:hypothetical protein AMATHDRAFT_11416 [Amanita thiersii Skay4041]